MEVNKLVYEVREKLGAISDDRRIDDRLILHLIDVARALNVTKLLKKPSTSVAGLSQDVVFKMEVVDSAVYSPSFSGTNVMRSIETLPKLLDPNIPNVGFRARTVDVIYRDLEVVRTTVAGNISFEFNVLKVFLASDNHLYCVSKDTLKFKELLITAVFESPSSVVDTLDNYPVTSYIWAAIKPGVIDELLRKVPEDPFNNSEPDYNVKPPKKAQNDQV